MHPMTHVGLGYGINTSMSIALGIGLSDLFLNHKIPDSIPGAGTSTDDAEHPALTTLGVYVRSVGSSWRGYALVLWWISRDAKNRTGPLAFLGVAMTLNGAIRTAAALKFGIMDPFTCTATVAEAAGPAMLYMLMIPMGTFPSSELPLEF